MARDFLNDPLERGVHDVSIADYVADRLTAEPSFSVTTARWLLARSPRHAWWHHPRLGGKGRRRDEEYSADAAFGTVVHELLLGSGDGLHVLEFPDFRSNAAKEARDAAIEQGLTPILAHHHEFALQAVDAAREQLRAHKLGLFTERPGAPEQTFLWIEENVWCRARPDWVSDDEPALWNLKTVDSAEPDAWALNLARKGHHLSAAHYLRGARDLFGEEFVYRYILLERRPPFGLSIVEVGIGSTDLGLKERNAALRMFGRCLREDRWPGYPSSVCVVDARAWDFYQHEDKRLAGRYEPAFLDELLLAGAPH